MDWSDWLIPIGGIIIYNIHTSSIYFTLSPISSLPCLHQFSISTCSLIILHTWLVPVVVITHSLITSSTPLLGRETYTCIITPWPSAISVSHLNWIQTHNHLIRSSEPLHYNTIKTNKYRMYISFFTNKAHLMLEDILDSILLKLLFQLENNYKYLGIPLTLIKGPIFIILFVPLITVGPM